MHHPIGTRSASARVMTRHRSNSCPPTELNLEPVEVKKSTSEPGCDVANLESLADFSDIQCESSEGASLTPQETEPEQTPEQLAAQQVEALKAELAALQNQNQQLDQIQYNLIEQTAPPTPPPRHHKKHRGHRQHAPPPIFHHPPHPMMMPPMSPYMHGYPDSDEMSPYHMHPGHFPHVSPMSPHVHPFPHKNKNGRNHRRRQMTPPGAYGHGYNEWAHPQYARAY